MSNIPALAHKLIREGIAPRNELDDLIQEGMISEWQGRNPYWGMMDYLRNRGIIGRGFYRAGFRVFYAEEVVMPTGAYTEDHTDLILLEELFDSFDELELAVRSEFTNDYELAARYKTSRARISQKRKVLKDRCYAKMHQL